MKLNARWVTAVLISVAVAIVLPTPSTGFLSIFQKGLGINPKITRSIKAFKGICGANRLVPKGLPWMLHRWKRCTPRLDFMTEEELLETSVNAPMAIRNITIILDKIPSNIWKEADLEENLPMSTYIIPGESTVRINYPYNDTGETTVETKEGFKVLIDTWNITRFYMMIDDDCTLAAVSKVTGSKPYNATIFGSDGYGRPSITPTGDSTATFVCEGDSITTIMEFDSPLQICEMDPADNPFAPWILEAEWYKYLVGEYGDTFKIFSLSLSGNDYLLGCKGAQRLVEPRMCERAASQLALGAGANISYFCSVDLNPNKTNVTTEDLPNYPPLPKFPSYIEQFRTLYVQPQSVGDIPIITNDGDVMKERCQSTSYMPNYPVPFFEFYPATRAIRDVLEDMPGYMTDDRLCMLPKDMNCHEFENYESIYGMITSKPVDGEFGSMNFLDWRQYTVNLPYLRDRIIYNQPGDPATMRNDSFMAAEFWEDLKKKVNVTGRNKCVGPNEATGACINSGAGFDSAWSFDHVNNIVLNQTCFCVNNDYFGTTHLLDYYKEIGRLPIIQTQEFYIDQGAQDTYEYYTNCGEGGEKNGAAFVSYIAIPIRVLCCAQGYIPQIMLPCPEDERGCPVCVATLNFENSIKCSAIQVTQNELGADVFRPYQPLPNETHPVLDIINDYNGYSRGIKTNTLAGLQAVLGAQGYATTCSNGTGKRQGQDNYERRVLTQKITYDRDCVIVDPPNPNCVPPPRQNTSSYNYYSYYPPNLCDETLLPQHQTDEEFFELTGLVRERLDRNPLRTEVVRNHRKRLENGPTKEQVVRKWKDTWSGYIEQLEDREIQQLRKLQEYPEDFEINEVFLLCRRTKLGEDFYEICNNAMFQQLLKNAPGDIMHLKSLINQVFDLTIPLKVGKKNVILRADLGMMEDQARKAEDYDLPRLDLDILQYDSKIL